MAEKMREKEYYDSLKAAWYTEEELKVLKQKEELCKKEQYRKELQDQMIRREKNRRFLYEEFLREKKLIDEIIERINDEDERAMQDKMCKMQKTRDEMNAFKVAQALWREKQKKELEEENLRIQEYIKKICDEERRRYFQLALFMLYIILLYFRYDEKQKEKARQEALSERISRQIYAEEVSHVLPMLKLNVVRNDTTLYLDGRHLPKASKSIG